MLIKVNDEVLAIKFRHGIEDERKPNGHKNRNAGRHYTECVVKLKRTIDKWYDSKKKVHETKISFFDDVAFGKATCSLDDKFDKCIGRAISVSRAIEYSNHPLLMKYKDSIIDEFCKQEKISTICAVPPKELPKIKDSVKIADLNIKAKPDLTGPDSSDAIALALLPECGTSRVQRRVLNKEELAELIKNSLAKYYITVPNISVTIKSE